MAKLTATVDVEVVKFVIIFFPIATFSRVGDVMCLTVFGFSVYQATGQYRKFLGYEYLKG